MNRFRGAAIGLCALIAAVGIAHAAGMWSTLPQVGSPGGCISTVSGPTFGPQGNVGGAGATGQGQAITGSNCQTTLPAGPPFLTGNEYFPADTGLQLPATVTIPIQLGVNFSGTPRNYLDNGSLNVQQRGTGTVTCGTTSGVPSSAYGPDRWGCDTNVTSGAGRTAIVTTAALLPAGFAQVNTVFRTSGALTQPVCQIQEIPTVKATALAGKVVALSVYAAALAGLSADNGNLITVSIFTGTGSDQGLGTMTASPAITPAWTGIASPLNQSVLTITTTPGRYALPAPLIPATTTEAAVAICFTPTATGAGATDGFAWVGAQLEVSPSPSPYEFHDIQQDTAIAERYFYQISEGTITAGSVMTPGGNAVTATTCAVDIPFPVTMRTAPTYANALTATTFKLNSAAVNTALSTPFSATTGANTVYNASLTFTASGLGATPGFACELVSAAGSGVMQFTADF
jgi:hypothetical protein